MSDVDREREAAELKLSPAMDDGQIGQEASGDDVDASFGMEARIVLKSVRIPAEGDLSDSQREAIREVVRDHLKANKLTLREVARQAAVGETSLSEVLKGSYKFNPDKYLRKLNGWLDDDERRRQRKRPIGFYPTQVFETIRALAQLAKSNARTPDSQRKPVAEHEPAKIALGWGPAGCGKTLGAQALHAEDVLSVLIRVQQKSGTDSGVASLIIDAMGIRGAKRGSAIKFAIQSLTDTGRLLIVDEAHRLKFSGCEFLRDLADVAGIPILLLGTEEAYRSLAETRRRGGSFSYDQFARRVCHVADLMRGMDGKGGIKRPVYSVAEIRAMFQGDTVRITPDAYDYLQGVGCTPGLGMLGMAAVIFEKAHRTALRGRKIVDAALLRNAARLVLFPAGGADEETMIRIERTVETVQRMAASA